MSVIVVIAIVMGLLYSYQDEGWKLFYQSYYRGLSQLKAKLAIRILTEELMGANKARIAIGRGTSYGIPMPKDTSDNSPYIYFTKPRFFEATGDVTGYDYVLYYFAKPKERQEEIITKKLQKPKEEYNILKSLKFLNQSKIYTEDKEKTWPFEPPLIAVQKSRLPEDEAVIEATNEVTTGEEEEKETEEEIKTSPQEEMLFVDHFEELKKESRNIPLSGNFLPSALTDPFLKEEVSFSFGQEYKVSQPIKIKVKLQETPVFFGLGAMTEFEVSVTPRN